MVRKKLDSRIRTLIENGVGVGHRSLFVLVGDKGRDQVVILHHMLSKARVSARPSVLWCYKKELGFTSHRKKRMRQLQKKMRSGLMAARDDDPFELFISSTHIRYCYYAETHKILGNTFGMCVLQDFEALTPNLLARTIETVEGGGLVVLLLRSVASLRQLYTMTMDVHSRFRTEAHRDVVGRFNERFILSLSACAACAVVDDQLNILPITSHVAKIERTAAPARDEPTAEETELKSLQESMNDTQPIGALLDKCRTACQAKALLRLLDAVTEKTLRATVSVTAARGRGKSAALGLAVAGAVGFGYSNIFVTSPNPENLRTLFEFVLKGFDALTYQEHIDYEIIQSTNPDFNKAVVRINIFRGHRQTIQYIHAGDAAKLGQAELLVVDEAAAIPLPLVRALLGPYLVFLASTVNGYEGTGRSLTLKLLQQLREKSSTGATLSAGRTLHELTLEESIRYRPGDPVELWLNQLLCLDATSVHRMVSGCPPPSECQLYYINRDTLFSFHKASETFLQRLMSIYVAAHYKNTPNDLQLLSDAPAHQLFCLLGPVHNEQTALPEVLVVLQVCLEGEISKKSVVDSLSRGRRAAGDLVPWTVAQQFQDDDFPALSGARVVRIATHPDFQGMGYGGRALELLQAYYEGKFGAVVDAPAAAPAVTPAAEDEPATLLDEERLAPRADLPPLLSRLDERRAESLDYLGVAFGLTLELLRFWKRAKFVPVYVRQTANELTGEHSCLMLKMIGQDPADIPAERNWLFEYWKDFRRRMVNLLGFEFCKFAPTLALSILDQKQFASLIEETPLTVDQLRCHLTNSDLRRLELYSQNMVDHHLITDLLPTVARLFYVERLSYKVRLSAAQAAILLGMGLQHKSVETLSGELELPVNQLLALFNKSIRKLVEFFNGLCERLIEEREFGSAAQSSVAVEPAAKSLQEDLEEAAADIRQRQERDKADLRRMQLSEFAIRGSEDDWQSALGGGRADASKPSGLLSVKSNAKRSRPSADAALLDDDGGRKPSKGKRRKSALK